MQKGDVMDAAERSERIPDIVIITGMSGSGRTQAMHVFEDMGYFCIDNLPPRLIAQLAELVGINTGVGRHLAVTCDLRSQGLFDELLDVRFLPNPFYDPEMRTMTGLDKKVSDFVLDHPKTQEFWKAWTQLLDTVMPGYIAEGKPQLSIAIGCTGGQHRSVAIAEATARYLEGAQYHVSISHRDLSRANTKA